MMEITEIIGDGENETDKAIPPLSSSPSREQHDNGRFMSSCLLVTQGVIVYAHFAVLSFLVVRVHGATVVDMSNNATTNGTGTNPVEGDSYYNERQKVLSKCHGILFTFAAFILTIIVQELYIRAEKESKVKASIDMILLAATYTLLLLITMYQLKHSMIYNHFGLFYLFILAYFAVTLLMTLIYVARLCNKMRRLGRTPSQ